MYSAFALHYSTSAHTYTYTEIGVRVGIRRYTSINNNIKNNGFRIFPPVNILDPCLNKYPNDL